MTLGSYSFSYEFIHVSMSFQMIQLLSTGVQRLMYTAFLCLPPHTGLRYYLQISIYIASIAICFLFRAYLISNNRPLASFNFIRIDLNVASLLASNTSLRICTLLLSLVVDGHFRLFHKFRHK